MAGKSTNGAGTRAEKAKPRTVKFGKTFVYRGVEIHPTANTRSARAREIYEAMKEGAAQRDRAG